MNNLDLRRFAAVNGEKLLLNYNVTGGREMS